jgi:NADPH-dependent glutamate synthase beta subunit-like oxidoreductase
MSAADPISPARADPGAVVVIGAGPAGLTAAYQLGKAGHTCTVPRRLPPALTAP